MQRGRPDALAHRAIMVSWLAQTEGAVRIKLKAAAEQLQARLGLRRSNAAQPHRNKKREAKRPGKGNRSKWKTEHHD